MSTGGQLEKINAARRDVFSDITRAQRSIETIRANPLSPRLPPRHRSRPPEALSAFLSTRCYIRGMSIRSGLRKLKPGASAPVRHLWRAFLVIALIGALGIVLWLML